MKAREFDKKFDEGEDISKYLDISEAVLKKMFIQACGWNMKPADTPRPSATPLKRGVFQKKKI